MAKFLVIAIGISLTTISPKAQATTLFWDANGTTAPRTDGAGTWTTANQWTNTVAGNGGSTWNSVTPDDAVIGTGGTGGTIVLGAANTAGSLSLAAFTGTYSLATSGSLALTGTANYDPSNYIAGEPNTNLGTVGIYISSSAALLNITRGVTLGSSQSWINNSASMFTVNGTNGITTLGANALTIDGSGPTTLAVINGVGGSLNKIGAGALTLSGNSTFDGGVFLKTGSLNIATSNTAFGTGILKLGDTSGSTAVTLDSTTGGRTITNAVNINQAFTFTGTQTLAQGTGAVSIATANPTVTVTASTLTLGGVTTDSGNGLTKAGAGTLVISGANGSSYTGNTTINAGILNFANGSLGNGNGTITFGGNSTLLWGSGNTQDISNKSLNSTGFTGTLDLGANNVTFATANGLTGSGNFTKSTGAGIFTLGAANNLTGTYTASATGGTTLLTNANALQSATVTPSSATGITFDSSVVANAFTFGNLTGAGNLSLQNNAAAPIALSVGANNGSPAAYTGILSGSGSLVKTGSGTLTLNNANTFVGGLNIQAGTVKLGGTTSAGPGSVTLGVVGDATSGTLDLNGASRTIAGTLGTAGTAANQTITSTVAGGILNYTGGTTTFGGTITGSTPSFTGVTLNNASTVLTLTGANTYGGATTLTAGTLKLGSASAMGNVGNSVAFSNGTTLSYASDSAINSYNLTTVATAGGLRNLVVDRATAGVAVDQTIGSLSFPGSNTNGGDTINVTVGPNVLSGTPTLTFNSVTGLDGSRVAHLAGNVVFSIGSMTSAGNAGTGTYSLEGTAQNNEVTGTISDNGVGLTGITINTSGGWTFSGANSYTGPTTATGGGTATYNGAGGSVSGASAFAATRGTIILDNTNANNNARLSDASAVTLMNGNFTLKGNSVTATSETVGGLTMNAGTNTITVQHNGGTGGSQLSFTDSGNLRDSTSMTVNFIGTGGSLGSSGDNPRITFTGAINTNTTNGMLATTTSATTQTIGWAVVNGTNWAGNGANGIVALSDTARNSSTLATAASWELTNFAPSSTTTTLSANLGTSATVSLGALKISPTASGQTLALGTNNIFSPALMLTGNTDFDITGTTGGLQIGAGTRYIWVTEAGTTLNYGAALPSTGPLNKAGAGILFLNGSSTQLPAANTSILDGVLRGTLAALGGGASTGGASTTLNFRGGVLEIDGGGSAGTFSRAIDLAGAAGGGGITWDTTGGANLGSGGFSAINGNIDVTLVTAVGGSTPDSLVWGNFKFVPNGQALLMGSTKSDSRITLTNDLALDAGGAGPLTNREIRVADNASSTTDVTRLSGVISGTSLATLVKTGNGTLELTNANTYAGPTTVSAGALLINGTHTGAGSYFVNSGATLGGIGTITGASNASITLASGAKLAPGNSPGTLTASLSGTGKLDVSAAVGGANAGALVFELGAVGPGTSDSFSLTAGTLVIGSGLLEFSDFNFTALSGIAAGTYTLFDTTLDINGTLGSNLSGTIGGFNGVLSFANTNDDLVLTLSAVPEPSVPTLLLAGLGVLLTFQRRRRN